MTFEESQKCNYFPDCQIHLGRHQEGTELDDLEIAQIRKMLREGKSPGYIRSTLGVGKNQITKVIQNIYKRRGKYGVRKQV